MTKRKIGLAIRCWYSTCLCLCLFFSVSLSLFAQPNQIPPLQITESFEQQPLSEVLTLFKEKYQVNFAYDHQAVVGELVTCQLREASLSEALAQIFAGSNLVYQQQNARQVLLRKETSTGDQPSSDLLTYRGRIIDQLTGEPLAYAAVYLPGQTVGTATDEQGFFTLQCSASNPDQQVRIQYLGYESKEIDLAGLTGEVTQPIALSMATNEINNITIVEKLPPLSLQQVSGSSKLRVERLASLPDFAAGQDVIRNLQMLPGINAVDDFSAGIKVRGSDGDENMVLLDGITLYNLNHFFGVFSLLNPEVVDEATLYKNAFPVEYGGRNASVVDIVTKSLDDPEERKTSGAATFNLLTSQAYVQLPLGKKMSFLLGGRTTNFDIAKTQLFEQSQEQNPLSGGSSSDSLRMRNQVVSEKPTFRFYDYNLKWNWQLTPRTHLQIAHFQSEDDYQYNYEETYNYLVTRDVSQRREELYTQSANWKNMGQSIQLQHQWRVPLTSTLNFSRSTYENEDSLQIRVTVLRRLQRDTDLVNTINTISNKIEGTELNLKNAWQISPTKLLTFGYHLVDNDMTSLLQINRRVAVDQEFSGQQHSGYLEWKEQWLNGDLRLSAGLRGTWYTPTQTMFYSPRLRLDVQVTPSLSLKGAFSRYHQFIRQTYHENYYGQTFDFWIMANQNEVTGRAGKTQFPVSSSTHYMLGWTFRKAGFLLDVELYQKDNEGVVEHGSSIIGLDERNNRAANFFFFYGDGSSIGLDLLLQKDIGAYSSWIAYTLSKTTNRFRAINGNESFPSRDDRRHQFKWINQYSLARWNLSLTYVFSSGRPYTDLSINDRQTDRNPEQIGRLADYHRVDLGVQYQFPIGGTSATVGASCFNLFDRANVKYRQYIYDNPENANTGTVRQAVGTDVEMLGFTPNLSFSWKF